MTSNIQTTKATDRMSRQTTTNGTNSPRGGSLSSAVSSLVRAQYGLTSQSESGASSSITDLDKHVADLLLKEAKEREARSKSTSNSLTSWSFSDDEDGSTKQYQNKTNKRFLKNILKGVEDHNAPLRRKESGETLEEIRQRERKARELRLGIKDAERNRKDASTSSSSSAPGRSAPGFAARMLANGLSGALNTREEKTRDDRQIKNAIEDARRRAEKDNDREGTGASSTSKRDGERDYIDTKGKGRERRGVESDYGENEERHRRRRRSTSREREEVDYRPSSHRSRRDISDNHSDADKRERKHRSRYVEKNTEHIASEWVLMQHASSFRSRSRSPRNRDVEDDKRRHRDRGDERRSSRQGREKHGENRRRRDRSYSVERDSNKKSRRRSVSRDSRSSLSDHPSEASSDTFIDYTGAEDIASTSHGGGAGSKMDKYFSSAYNPALDINIGDLEDPKTGLIGEGNFSEWDKMLHTLKKRKEDKVFGVTKAREEERERQLRKLERRRKREERELRHAIKHKEKKNKKKRRRSSDSDSNSDSSIGPNESTKRDGKKSKDPGTVNIDGYEYVKQGSTRAWDMGKA